MSSELKRVLKAKEKAKKDEEKKKAQADAPKKGEGKAKAKVEEEVDPSKYTDNRKKFIQDLRDQGGNPYPHKFSRSHRIDQFRAEFDEECAENGEFKDDVNVALTGRINSIRASGSKLIFIDLAGDQAKV